MTTWTVVYRKPRANRFTRTGFTGTWQEAHDKAAEMAEADTTVEIYYVGSDDATVYVTDARGNNPRRIRIAA